MWTGRVLSVRRLCIDLVLDGWQLRHRAHDLRPDKQRLQPLRVGQYPALPHLGIPGCLELHRGADRGLAAFRLRRGCPDASRRASSAALAAYQSYDYAAAEQRARAADDGLVAAAAQINVPLSPAAYQAPTTQLTDRLLRAMRTSLR